MESECPVCKSDFATMRIRKTNFWGCGGCGKIWYSNSEQENCVSNNCMV